MSKDYTTWEESIKRLSNMEMTKEQFQEWVKPSNSELDIKEVFNEKNQDIFDMINAKYSE